MKKIPYYLLPLLLLAHACKNNLPNLPEPGVNPEITEIAGPDTVYAVPGEPRWVYVTVADPQGIADLAEVRYSVIDDQSSQEVASGELADDGGAGDILAGDGQFYGPLSGALTGGQTGAFTIRFTAEDDDGHASASEIFGVTILPGAENRGPRILTLITPALLRSDSLETARIEATVEDPDGPDDVTGVVIQVFAPRRRTAALVDTLRDDGADGDVAAGDGVFSRTIDSGFAEGRIGKFSLKAHAIDRLGGQSHPKVAVISVFSRAQNQPPVLSNSKAPSTISRSSVSTFRLTVDAWDPQGLADIEKVWIDTFRPDGTPSSGNPNLLRDDGNQQQGDQVAGDGTYSQKFEINPAVATGVYRFEFKAEDFSGERSNVITHFITVVE